MAPRKPRKASELVEKKQNRDDVQLPENERLQLQDVITAFIASGQPQLLLPKLSNVHRKYLHRYASRMGLKTRSYGSKNDRILHITARIQAQKLHACQLPVAPVTSRQLAEMAPRLRSQLAKALSQSRQQQHQLPQQQQLKQNRRRGGGFGGGEEILLLDAGQRMVPPRAHRISAELHRDKQELPIYAYQDDIHNMLQQHSIFIINGETGSGKTTQVPQYILNEACRRQRPCRVVVSEPRRVAAVASAHRVAEERGEQVGESVGYQIRMESRVRKSTNLIYTTSGCLLRAIMTDSSHDLFFHKVTHLIIDEIHERDKYTDFTLITLKQQLKRNANLRVILMSATMDIQLLSHYFDDCPVLTVPGQGYDVKIYHLEDILFHTGYRTALMEKYLRSLPPVATATATVPAFGYQEQDPLAGIGSAPPTFNDPALTAPTTACRPVCLADQYLQELIDSLLDGIAVVAARSMVNGSIGSGGSGGALSSDEELNELFDQLQYYIESEGVPVDIGHSRTGLTPLMAACQCNRPRYVQLLMLRQANVELRDVHGWTAIDYARQYDRADNDNDNGCLQFLDASAGLRLQQQTQMQRSDAEKQRILGAYQQQFNDDHEVDHDLILSLIEGLYRSSHPGAIMVFLPGYNDIVQQRDLITSTLPGGTYRICILHGQMDSQDQFEALQQHRVRKIILSTNIGQTSITIPDLAYIIDSGKVKMKNFDAITESSQLQSVWIAQADANQRSGRAGRTQNGVCYRLYSLARYRAMSKFSIAEFMRIPLTEICLYAKTLDGECAVQAYLARALQPPSSISVQNAVRKLQLLEVFNDDESVTDLGRHLVDIPLDVQLGKCLLYAVYLRCFEPVLTIVAYHSVKDPFILPTERSAQGQASFQRKSLAGQSFSDQMGILALYKAYTTVRSNRKRARDFCNKYYLSQPAMEMFLATRRQIADVLSHRFRLGGVQCDDWNLVRLCLVAGFYPNVASIDRSKCVITAASFGDGKLMLQRTSALNPPGMKNLKDFVDTLPHDWIVFYEKSSLGRGSCSINMNTIMPPLAILLLGGRECEVVDTLRQNHDGPDSGDSSDAIDSDLEDDEEVEVEAATPDDDNNDATESVNATAREATKALRALTLGNHNNHAAAAVLAAAAPLARSSSMPALISLDNWIRFELQSSADAEHLLLLRQVLRLQFLAFLRPGGGSAQQSQQRSSGPAGSATTAATWVQKLLSADPSFV